MKNTIIMIVGIVVTVLTFWGIVAILQCITNLTWLECKQLGFALTIFFGWTPALVIGKDIEDNY